MYGGSLIIGDIDNNVDVDVLYEVIDELLYEYVYECLHIRMNVPLDNDEPLLYIVLINMSVGGLERGVECWP